MKIKVFEEHEAPPVTAPGGMDWMNEQRPVLSWWEQAEREAQWWDATLDAATYFEMEGVPTIEAALILCRHHPKKVTEREAEEITVDLYLRSEVAPEHFKMLRSFFESHETVHPGDRTLLEWMRLAEQHFCIYHFWASKYAARRFGVYGPPTPSWLCSEE